MTRILIGADICPIERNQPYFARGDAGSLFNDLLEEFEGADLVLANLECPLIRRSSPIRKTGPVFGEDPACINGIRAAGINVLGLANNHIMDHGMDGLRTTVETCVEAGVATVGAGENLVEARRMFIRDVAGVRVGILAVAEHEFSIATEESGGACPLDLVEFVRVVEGCREQFDYLVVLLHGGDEFMVPSPRIVKTSRFMVEIGANAVIVQHPHCLGGYENYRGGHIVYGQGALVMDEAVYRGLDSFHWGYLVRLDIGPDFRSRFEAIPFVQSSPTPGARRMNDGQQKKFRDELHRKSEILGDDALVRENWIRFCERRRYSYLSTLFGHGRILRKLNSTGLVTRLLCRGGAALGVRNVLRCETHREALETILNGRASGW